VIAKKGFATRKWTSVSQTRNEHRKVSPVTRDVSWRIRKHAWMDRLGIIVVLNVESRAATNKCAIPKKAVKNLMVARDA
jgi:hypothetical protein